jgi:hypothetical protein
MSVTRKQWAMAATVGVLLLAGIAVWVNGSAIADFLAEHRADFDIVSMLKEADQTNTAILKANAELVKSLEGVKQEAGAVTGVSGRLKAMEAGLGEQADVLSRLDGLTSDQADLSVALQRLTASVTPSTQQLARTAGQQADAVEAMSRTGAGLARRMEAIGAANASTADKLWRAEAKSATVLSEMP